MKSAALTLLGLPAFQAAGSRSALLSLVNVPAMHQRNVRPPK